MLQLADIRRRVRGLTRSAWLTLMAVAALAVAAPSEAAATNRHALLVGVSSYPSLAEDHQLHGPKNDVTLLRSVLERRGFAASAVRVLADQVQGAHGEPTRAAILAELDALAARVRDGDYVLLYFAGHGTQQPVRDRSPGNPEPDGLDEVFLPRDIGTWTGSEERGIENAIIDDEFAVPIRAMRARGAFVWAVFDTCHSGTITRGFEPEGVRYRDLPPATLGVPLEALDRARRDAAGRARGPGAPSAPKTALQGVAESKGRGGFVAFYAAQSHERAPEEPLPANLSAGHPAKKTAGLFTFSLVQALETNPGLTYRQAMEEVLHRYRGLRRAWPTPTFEGDGLDRRVFGADGGPVLLHWPIERTGSTLRVAAGHLHGLSDGAIFAVMARAGDPDSAALGYLRATRVDLLQSTVEPVAHDGKARLQVDKIAALDAERASPDHAFARLIDANASFALRILVHRQARGPTDRVLSVLDELASAPIAGLAATWAKPGEAADIHLLAREGKLWFLPPSGEMSSSGPAQGAGAEATSIVLAGKSDDEVRRLTADTLCHMARAINLVRLATLASGSALSRGVEVSMALKRDGKSEALPGGRIPRLRDKDGLVLEVTNGSRDHVDANLLFISSRFGIEHLGRERIRPGDKWPVELKVDASTVGRESLLVVLTPATAQRNPEDFSFLAQPSLAASRQGPRDDGPAGDLTDLFEAVGFGTAGTRNVRMVRTLASTGIRIVTFDVTK